MEKKWIRLLLQKIDDLISFAKKTVPVDDCDEMLERKERKGFAKNAKISSVPFAVLSAPALLLHV